MVEIHRLRDLEDRGQGYGCTAQYGEDKVTGEASFLHSDVEIYGKVGILDCW